METTTSGSVHCALCGAANAPTERVCHACRGRLPSTARVWTHPAFERMLPSSLGPAGVGETPERSHRVGWEWLRACSQTIVSLLLHPDRTFRSFRLDGGFGAPAAFVTAVGSAVLFVRLLTSSRVDRAGPTFWWQVALAALAPLVYVYVRAQIVHLVLVFGGKAKEAFEVTFRVVAYGSAAAAVFLVVPMVGEFLFLATGVWIESTGLRRCHSTSLEAAIVAEVTLAAVLSLTVLAALTARVL